MNRRRFLLGAGAVVAMSACGGPPTIPTPVTPTPQPPTTPPSDPVPPSPPVSLRVARILAFGDSITEGTTSAPLPTAALTAGLPVSYPFKLQTQLSNKYTQQTIAVLNAGKAGERATEGRSRLGSAMAEAKPEVVLLMDGANDLLALGGPGVAPTVDAMEELIRDIASRGAQPIVLTMLPQRLGGQRGSAAPFVSAYNQGLKQIAQKRGALLFDVNARFDLSLVGVDGLHPTEAGYQMLATLIAEALQMSFEVTG